MLRPRQVDRILRSIGRLAKAISLNLDQAATAAAGEAGYGDRVKAIYGSKTNRRLMSKLLKLRRLHLESP